jgi:hypothetical protein
MVEVTHRQIPPGSESEYWRIFVIHACFLLFFLKVFQCGNWAEVMSGERKQVDIFLFFT